MYPDPLPTLPSRCKRSWTPAVNVARINRSHGRAEDQEEVIGRIREAAAASGRAVAILVDLQGPKIRLGRFVDDQKVMLNKGDEFTITTDDILGTVKRVSTTFKGLPGDCRPGDRLLIDDGNVAVRVTRSRIPMSSPRSRCPATSPTTRGSTCPAWPSRCRP